VCLSVCGYITLTVEFAVNEITLVIAAILPLVATLSFLLSVCVVSLVFHCLLNDFSTFAVLSIFFPLSIVSRVLTLENTMAISLVIGPLTLVQVSVGLGHATDSRHYIVVEHALVDATILHFKLSNAILAHLTIQVSPLSIVYHTITNFLVKFDQESFFWTVCELLKGSLSQKRFSLSCS